MDNQGCRNCGDKNARHYQLHHFGGFGELCIEYDFILCVRCARDQRTKLKANAKPNSTGPTRHEVIAALDNFFAASGVFDICGRCHEQGTGCCPPTCRVMGDRGCDPNNKYGKTVFCATFICGALMNAISECDAELGRKLKWIKNEIGPAEFHIYEMITRVPVESREPVRPFNLPQCYPQIPITVEDGTCIKDRLGALADEVLEIRRRWR